jgi:hypothetical protein
MLDRAEYPPPARSAAARYAANSTEALALAATLVLTDAAAVSERWAIFRAGSAAAADDMPQRARIAAGQSRGAARTEPRVAPSRRGSPATALDG